jgi:hypothetical protein
VLKSSKAEFENHGFQEFLILKILKIIRIEKNELNYGLFSSFQYELSKFWISRILDFKNSGF